MIKICTVLKKCNNFGKLKQFFNIKEPLCASSFPTIPSTLSTSYLFISISLPAILGRALTQEKYVSFVVSDLIPGQIFWKTAKVFDRQLSVISARKNITFHGFYFESQRFFRFKSFLRSFKTVVFIT